MKLKICELDTVLDNPELVGLGGKRELIKTATELLIAKTGVGTQSLIHISYVPGRIEILGKHTDYGGGPSMVMGLDRGFVIVSALNGTDHIRAWNVNAGFPGNSIPLVSDAPSIEGWLTYPSTAARRIAFNFGNVTKLQGVDMVVASDLPPASGMSSSSALIIASFFGIALPNALMDTPTYRENIKNNIDLAMYLAVVENGLSFRQLEGHRGVGTFGGSEDHTAILCSKPGQLAINYYCPTVHERSVPFPDEWAIVVSHSGRYAEKTGEAMEHYNAVSERLRRVLAVYNESQGTECSTLRDVVYELQDADSGTVNWQCMRDALAHLSPADSEDLFLRFEQFTLEMTEIIPQAADAILSRNAGLTGELVDKSQHLSDTHLRNIIPEVRNLQKLAREEGAIAASGFGAGFGGSVYAIVERDTATSFLDRWQSRYDALYPQYSDRPEAFVTRPSGPAEW